MFVCDIVDAAPKADMGSMEHPVFSLSTKPDMKPREYRNGDTFIKVSPSAKGLATVHDRDVLIYCISQCMAAINEGRKVNRTLKFTAHDMLVATNRQTSGRGYELLKDTLRRLQGTQIETNIKQGGTEKFSVFGLIDKAEVIRETRDGKMQDIEITLSDWVYDAIENNNVLTLSQQYFQLRKPIERRLYELARKHCGKQSKWTAYLSTLANKTGSTSSAKEFKRMITKVVKDNAEQQYLPEYTFTLEGDLLTVRPIRAASTQALFLKSDTYEEARKFAAGWDIRMLESEWREWVAAKNIKVRNADSNFISFCKKRGPYKQEELF
jgi:plasmid replication initiation protein|tara:strand:- start:1269 stop:2240 length:972 start_codon:yes stop_codon:yes gene_type:complete